MRSQGTAQELERRRRLAVTRVLEGYPVREVAAFLGVTERSVHRWLAACRQSGDLDALKAKPSAGRPRKLTPRQERTALGWLTKSPTAFGFAGELWTSRRLAALIERRWGIRFNPNYLVEWLSARRHSAQKPTSRAKERDSGGRRCQGRLLRGAADANPRCGLAGLLQGYRGPHLRPHAARPGSRRNARSTTVGLAAGLTSIRRRRRHNPRCPTPRAVVARPRSRGNRAALNRRKTASSQPTARDWCACGPSHAPRSATVHRPAIRRRAQKRPSRRWRNARSGDAARRSARRRMMGVRKSEEARDATKMVR